MTHYSLAHPAKSFTLRHNNTELLSVTPVATQRERVFQVFGSLVLDDLFDLGDHARDLKVPAEDDEPISRRFRLRGFVSSPGVQKMNRNSIYLFVNGRLIRDRLLLHAISAAYFNLMPPRLLSVRAAVSRLRRGGSRRERTSFEDDGSAIPPRLTGA